MANENYTINPGVSDISQYAPIEFAPVELPSLPSPNIIDVNDYSGLSGGLDKSSGSWIKGLGNYAASAGLDLLFESFGAWINNLFSRKTADYNYELSEQSAKNDYARQIEFWNMQNAYNSAEQQAARRRRAGLSVVDNVGSDTAGNLSSVGSGRGMGTALAPQVSFDIMPAIESFSRIQQMDFGNSKTAAETRNLFADLQLKGIQEALGKAGLKKEAALLDGIRAQNRKTSNEADEAFYRSNILHQRYMHRALWEQIDQAMAKVDYNTKQKVYDTISRSYNWMPWLNSSQIFGNVLGGAIDLKNLFKPLPGKK